MPFLKLMTVSVLQRGTRR